MPQTPKAETTNLEDRLDRMEEALLDIGKWCDAYPEDIFPPVDLDAARAKLGDDALFSKLHAEWARRIVSSIKGYVAAGLKMEDQK